ncbi:MAG: glycine/D-amino acid oxidase-like deaminating enzyme [Bradymonadia bacterium]|jgi:glycine/D-amino acid oxidase-like deaminating enzyme
MVHPFAGHRAAASGRRIAAFHLMRDWCAELQPDARTSVLRLGADGRKTEVWESTARKWDPVGRWIDADGLASIEPGLSDEFIGGIDVADGLCIDGQALVRVLLQTAQATLIRSAVIGVVSESNGATVYTDGGRSGFDAVVIAAGVGAVTLGLSAALEPMAGATVILEGPGPSRPLAAFGQLIPLSANRTLVAGTHRQDGVRAVSDDDRKRLIEKASRTLPRLSEARVVGDWAGVRAASRDRAPIVGQLEPNVFALAGLGSKGFLLGPWAATQLVASWSGEGELPADWSPDRFNQSS